MNRARQSLHVSVLIVTIALAFAAESGRGEDDGKKDASGEASRSSTPTSLQELVAIEARVVQTAGQVLPKVVGVNNSAGVIVSKHGLVLTAAHLGGLRNDSVTVRLLDGTQLSGKTLGICGQRDAAAVRISGDGPFPFVDLGSAKRLQPGDWCLLFGHGKPSIPGKPAALRLARVVEATPEKLITDCTVTSGDSGGPLFDLTGKLIGVNSYGFPTRVWHVPIETYRENWERLVRGDRWGGAPRIVHTFNLRPGAPPKLPATRMDRGHDLLRPVAKNAAVSIVRIACDGKPTCLGTVVADSGLIATKASELSGTVTCCLHDAGQVEARSAGRIEKYDLAFLQVESDGLVPITWAEPESVQSGRWVVAPGFDGKLLDVGVVGFVRVAVPLHIADLGIQFGSVASGLAKIESVTTGGAAANAGLRPGDIITAVDDQKTAAAADVATSLRSRASVSEVEVGVTRGEASFSKRVTLGRPTGPRILRRIPQGGAGIVVLTPRRRPGSSGSKRQGGFPDVFQHNATVSPSDCGGPLIGLDGKALGINTARTSGPASYGLPAHLIAAEVDE